MNDITKKNKRNFLESFGVQHKDIAFAGGIILILLVLFMPLPTFLLDFGLAVSLSISVLVLMVALWIYKPLDFNSFPTLLLIVTMLRLSLNIASTRLILSEGHTGTDAAGGIIEGFSQFIVGGNYVIGIIVFAILVIINFVVITKGSTRIAEVAARFTLDAIPGKQMAIDADLGAGIINDEEARERRKELEDESSFFGAMDGASKFVRGDAIAGLIITIINVIGGIIVGIVQHDMAAGDAANNYTVLTIGDGLVSQIPALIVSLSAGLIVTKGGAKGAANEAILEQLGKYPKALMMASLLLLGVGLLPGFPFLVFFILAFVIGAIAYLIKRSNDKKEKEALMSQMEDEYYYSEVTEETPEDILKLDDIRLELGAGLVSMITHVDAALPGKVKTLRNLFAKEFGFIIPSVRIKDESRLPNNTYTIHIQGVEVARGDVKPNSFLVIDPMEGDIQIPGEKTKDPTFGLNAVWIDPQRSEEAERQGYTVVDPESVITTHLTEIVKEHMPSLLTYGATQNLVEGLNHEYQKLATELMPHNSPIVLMQRILQNLLAERVSIRNLNLIVESVAESMSWTSNVTMITEHVRSKLANQICQALQDENGYIPVITLSTNWETDFLNSVQIEGDERTFVMSPERVQEFVLAARQQIQQFAQLDQWPAIMVSPEIRPFVRSMLERISQMTQIISHNEIHRKAPLKNVATIG
jgi:flagellar biosynthesis protein FlhA